MNDSPILGVLGGMGPQASATFYQRLTAATQARRDQDHLRVLLWSDASIPDRTAGILSGEEEPVFEALLSGLKLLEGAGCGVLAVTCNTAHFFADRLQQQLSVPLIHMIRETARAARDTGAKRVGLLATDGTVQTGLYQRELRELGLESVTPTPALQKQVMSLIYDEIKQGRPGALEDFAPVDAFLRNQGCGCAILGCTELSVFGQTHALPPYYIDAMDVLVRQCMLSCGKTPQK